MIRSFDWIPAFTGMTSVGFAVMPVPDQVRDDRSGIQEKTPRKYTGFRVKPGMTKHRDALFF
ncbi:MAG: hypothetical protein HF978_15500 [Desulfobacteraceae bacterium]|nr:hypothetical protein [Desulfobacteraceae bacterium]MBC2756947.1 hypothetical protein [Desulfobacteraceae bacterium]